MPFLAWAAADWAASATARRVPSEVKSRPCAILRPSSADNRAGKEEGSPASGVFPRVPAGPPGRPALSATVVKTASRSQYSAGRKAMRSRSLATTRRVATDCTRPADSRGMTFFHSTGETSYPYSRSSTRRVW